jgi:uncharacterized repeat protein (TIGR02543 family)
MRKCQSASSRRIGVFRIASLRNTGIAFLLVSLVTLAAPVRAMASSVATVTFEENASPSDNVATFQVAAGSAPLTLFSNLSPAFSNPGYSFVNWNSMDTGSGTTYEDGQIYNFAYGDIGLYAQWRANTVTFYENQSGSDTVNYVEPGTTVQSLTLFADLSPSFSNSGFAFAGWTTNANGTGTSYANGASYDYRNGDLTLYAQWVAVPTVAASFATPGATGSVAPLSAPQGSQVTIPQGTGLSYPGHTFVGWNTAPDGSGTSLIPGSTYTLTSDVTLYAQWTPDTYTVQYVANGGTLSSTTASYVVDSSALTLPTPTFVGHTFTGWFTTPSGGDLVGLSGASYTPVVSVTLYAQWTADTYEVTFDPGSGTVAPASDAFVFGSSPITLPTPQDGQSTFLGWYSASSGGTLVGAAGSSYTPTQSVTLFAQWQAPTVYTITFDPNGGTGSIPPLSGTAGSTVTLPGVSGLSRPGYTMVNWSSAKTGGGSTYLSGTTMPLTASMTLFAQWSAKAASVILGAVGPFSGRTTGLTKAMKSQISRLATLIKRRGYKTVSLFGYAASTGLVSLTRSISARRATAVAAYLRSRLAALHVRVSITSAGEGSVVGASAAANRRVEVLAG